MQDSVYTSWQHKLLEKTLLATVEEQRRARRWRIFFKLVFLGIVLFGIYLWFTNKPTATAARSEHVALIDLRGEIGQNLEVDADEVTASLRRAFKEPKAKAILLRVNSPGGSPVQSAYVYDEIKRLRALHPDKKIYSVVSDLCASGCYYIVSATDQIYANASSLIGSIGVIMQNFGFVDAMKHVGVEQRTLTAGQNKAFLDPFSEKNPQQIEYAHELLTSLHAKFIQAVKKGRGDRLKENDTVFSGLIWEGETALSMGLIDGLGSAGYVAREIIGVEEIIDYSASRNFYDKIASHFGASFAKQAISQLGLQPALR